jgi:hypothetical protein
MRLESVAESEGYAPSLAPALPLSPFPRELRPAKGESNGSMNGDRHDC